MINKLAIFISTSENTVDVFDCLVNNMSKAFSAIPCQKFYGISTETTMNAKKCFTPICSQRISSWKDELLDQLRLLPDDIDFILLSLDDFYFFKRVNLNELSTVYCEMVEEGYDYLRLKYDNYSLFGRVEYLNSSLSIKKIPVSFKYISSLQVSIWNVEYLIAALENFKGSIWDFENDYFGGKHGVVSTSIVNTTHLVEKGKWFSFAQLLIKTSNRQSHSWGYSLRHFLRKLKFLIFGYAFIKG